MAATNPKSDKSVSLGKIFMALGIGAIADTAGNAAANNIAWVQNNRWSIPVGMAVAAWGYGYFAKEANPAIVYGLAGASGVMGKQAFFGGTPTEGYSQINGVKKLDALIADIKKFREKENKAIEFKVPPVPHQTKYAMNNMAQPVFEQRPQMDNGQVWQFDMCNY